MNDHAPALAVGLYPLPDAARLAHLDVRLARRWVAGNRHTYQGEKRATPGVIGADVAAGHPGRELTFPEMLTLRLVRGFREAGLSLRTIKRAAEIASAEFGTPTPFVTQHFRTDGRKIFVELQAASPANDEPGIPKRERTLIDVVTRQREFAKIVEPSLFRNLEWQGEMAARWWPLGTDHGVVLEPGMLFGAPHIAGRRVPTGVLVAAVQAEGGGEAAIAAVADWYGIPAGQVADALEFETVWLRQAA